jgi:pyruvate ferredoxin oxidoreductase delta subunit
MNRTSIRLRVDPASHFLPVAVADKGAAGRTGEWRTERPVVDASKCTSCYLCWLYCPDDVISMEPVGPGSKEIPVIDYEYCKGCGVCSNACPVGAISMVREVEAQ